MSIGFALGVKCAEGEPGGGGEHAEPAEGAGGVGDLDVVDEDVPLGEEDFVIVAAETAGYGCSL